MKKIVIALAAIFVAGASIAQNNIELKTFNDSASYAIGRDIFYGMTRQWDQQQLSIDKKIAIQAMMDCVNGQDNWDDKTAQGLLMRFQQAFEQRNNAAAQQNIEAGAKFMKENANNKSVYTTATGLQYRCLKPGNGKKPSMHVGEQGKQPDMVRVHYTGKLIDGKVFDSSVQRGTPMSFRLDQVIPGWTEGLQLMDEGSKYMLYIPYNLGYGMQAAGDIPAGSTLVFEVELLEINPSK